MLHALLRPPLLPYHAATCIKPNHGRFYGKAYFFDNTAWDGEGGAFYSENGDVR